MTEAEVTPEKEANELRFMPDEEKFHAEIAINPLDIDDAMLKNASLFAYYGHQAAKAEFQYDAMKTRQQKLEAILDSVYREEIAVAGKKVTEGSVDAAIKSDARWVKLNDKLAQARLIMNMGRVNKEAFMQRAELLRSIGATMRQERQGELRVMAIEGAGEINNSKREAAIAIAGAK